MPSPFSLQTPLEELYKYRLARFGQTLSHKLAVEIASHVKKPDAAAATVEDLLSYLPMRYEDRSNPAHIRDLTEGMEASLELYVKGASYVQVRNPRGFGRSSLFIFEVYATDPNNTGPSVVVWWFVSGTHAHDIIDYYKKRFVRGARFITFGRWERYKGRNTFGLRLNKPADELEMLLPPAGLLEANESEHSATQEQLPQSTAGDSKAAAAVAFDAIESGDPALAVIHTGRRVPIYRKLGEFSSKRVREIIHAALSQLSDDAFPETLPAELLKRRKLIGRADALRHIHFPPEAVPLALYDQSRSPAHLRLIFEDFFWVALGISLKRGKRTAEKKGAVIKIDRATMLRIGSVLPIK
jgi:ATP-dependent DNA helicase RecG